MVDPFESFERGKKAWTDSKSGGQVQPLQSTIA